MVLIVHCLDFLLDLIYHICLLVNGGWSSWLTGPCSKTCGGGVRNVTRECNNPRPRCGGKDCVGISIDRVSCNKRCCPSEILCIENYQWCIY